MKSFGQKKSNSIHGLKSAILAIFQKSANWLDWPCPQRYTNRVLQTIQMKLILLLVWAEPAVFGSAKTALKLKYKI